MVIPPTYSDLGKSARDLFDKGFSKYTLSSNAQPKIENVLYSSVFM